MKVFIITVVLFFTGCNQREEAKKETAEHSTPVLITADSLILMAEEALFCLHEKHAKNTSEVDSMASVIMMNSQLSRSEKSAIMDNIQAIEERCQQCYEQLKEAKQIQVLQKDSVVYNFTKKDSFVKVPVIVYDTIIKRIEVKKRGKRKKHE